MREYFPDENENLSSLTVKGGRSRFNNFFKHLGKDISHVAKSVGNDIVHTATGQLSDMARTGLQTGIQSAIENPELLMSAAGGNLSGGMYFHKLSDLHQKHFDAIVDKQKGGFFNVKRAFRDAKKMAEKEISKGKDFVKNQYETKVKPDFLQAREELINKGKKFADDKYSHLKHSLRDAVGLENPSQNMEEPSDEEYYDAQEGSGMRTRKMRKKRAPTKRNLLVGELMRKHGFKIGEASKYIKDHHLA